MSRTKRRKKMKTPLDYGDVRFIRRYYSPNRGYLYSFEIAEEIRNSEKYKKFCDFMYHRDTNVGYGWNANVPSRVRRGINRIVRAKMKQEVKRILIKGDFEEYSFNPVKSDAGYHYW
jgi:hypothetical protein